MVGIITHFTPTEEPTGSAAMRLHDSKKTDLSKAVAKQESRQWPSKSRGSRGTPRLRRLRARAPPRDLDYCSWRRRAGGGGERRDSRELIGSPRSGTAGARVDAETSVKAAGAARKRADWRMKRRHTTLEGEQQYYFLKAED